LKNIYCLLITALLFLNGCNNSQEKNLLGTWQETKNPKGALVFRRDHTGFAYWPDDSGKQASSEMKWEILKGANKVAVITSPGAVNFEITRDSLVAPNGVVLTRLK